MKTHVGNERFAKFLERHVGEIFTFLRQPQSQADGTIQFLDATNWRAEQAIRPAAAAQHALDLLSLLSRARTEAEPALVLAGR